MSMIPYKQLSLADIFSDCQNKFDNDKPSFLSLLETHIDINEFIPISFRNHRVSTKSFLRHLFLFLHFNIKNNGIAWSTPIPKRIFVLIPEQSEESKSGITPIKSGLLSKKTSITSKITYALQGAKPKTRILYMLI